MLPQHVLKGGALAKKLVRIVDEDKLRDGTLRNMKPLFNQPKVVGAWGPAMSKQGNDVNMPDEIN